MGPAQRPLHLLFFDESSADHLIDRRLHECRANRFPLPSTLAEVRDELAVIADVCSKRMFEKSCQIKTQGTRTRVRRSCLEAGNAKHSR